MGREEEMEGKRWRGTKKECREEREREKSNRVEIVNSIQVITETSLSCSSISTSESCQENLQACIHGNICAGIMVHL